MTGQGRVFDISGAEDARPIPRSGFWFARNAAPDARRFPSLEFCDRFVAIWEKVHAAAPSGTHRSHDCADGSGRQRLRLDGGQGDVFRRPRPLRGGGFHRHRHGQLLFDMGPGPSWRRIGDDHRRMDEGARQPQPHDRRHQGRLADGQGQGGPFARATSKRRSKRRSGACRPTSSTSICRTGPTWRRPSTKRSAPISG